jgi:hypothetical protein
MYAEFSGRWGWARVLLVWLWADVLKGLLAEFKIGRVFCGEVVNIL